MSVQAQYPSNILASDWRSRMRQMMVATENRTTFPAFDSNISSLDDAQLQLQISNTAAAVPNRLRIFNANQEQQQQVHYYPFFTGLSEVELARNLLGSRKRAREGSELLPAQRHKASSIPVATAVVPNQVPLHQATEGNISTGLCLAFNHETAKTITTPADGQEQTSVLFSSLSVRLASQLHQHKDEIDHYIELQAKQMKASLEEKRRQHFKSLFGLVEEAVSKKLREKEAEAERISRRNLELEDRLKQLSMETHAWQNKAKCNEAMVSALRINLQQAEAQSKELISREGCGDSEAIDDAVSSHGGDHQNGDYHTRMLQENKELKEQKSCRVCRSNDICMLLLPCRHLCLCKKCEGRLDVCPQCRCLKSASVQVYMS